MAHLSSVNGAFSVHMPRRFPLPMSMADSWNIGREGGGAHIHISSASDSVGNLTLRAPPQSFREQFIKLEHPLSWVRQTESKFLLSDTISKVGGKEKQYPKHLSLTRGVGERHSVL